MYSVKEFSAAGPCCQRSKKSSRYLHHCEGLIGSFGRNSRAIQRMLFIWFIARSVISNMSVLPRPNLKLDLEITNLLWKQTKKLAKLPHILTEPHMCYRTLHFNVLTKFKTVRPRTLKIYSSPKKHTGVRSCFPFHLLGWIKDKNSIQKIASTILDFSGLRASCCIFLKVFFNTEFFKKVLLYALDSYKC